jgi:hypothetical protein
MPLQNRVSPGGDIFATAARGMFMGNRGVLHDDHRRIVRTSRNPMWLICQLEFKGRRRRLMTPRRYTELFFLDEAVALAAGHRPCGECRRADYRAYRHAAGSEDAPISDAKRLDALLTSVRRAPRTRAAVSELPDGTFVALGAGHYHLLWRGALHRWSAAGYRDAIPVAALGGSGDRVEVVTPALSVRALRRGYRVTVHASAKPPTRD